MNATPQDRPTPEEYAELRRLLPAPGEPDLGADRQRQLRGYLMSEIRTVKPARSRRALLWTLAPAAAVVAAVVVVGVSAGTPPTGTHRATPAHSGTAAPGLTGRETAPQLLGKIALAADEQPAPAARPDQFVYVQSTVAFANVNGATGKTTVDKPHTRRVWMSVGGRRHGLLREKGESTDLGTLPHPDLHAPTYAYLKTLPTDPDALLAVIYAAYDAHPSGSGRDAEAFVTIGDLLGESLLPPKLAAALYGAAAKIPGVTVVGSATDAAGRTGVAVAREDREAGTRTEWVFDRHSLGYLGERQVQVTRTGNVPAGTVVGSTAVTRRAVVDRAGQLPK
ncbi:CU044_5270 family protein [Actinocatenispora rupis]|uniref:CU044_5270 family protein n=1 Tax=Actinocatenispora rupis TaxID=519421 RepID=A0A8J3JC94_9ACTN|nr:CU044_5270 family protein [Actinocatenispora rupis]GID15760.1 hypothetical protein Aru02nite_66490 [Actinocatenispora rupis]